MDSSSSSDERPSAAAMARAAMRAQTQAAREADAANISAIQEAAIHDLVTEQLGDLGLAGLMGGRSIRPRHEIRAVSQLQGLPQMAGLSSLLQPARPSRRTQSDLLIEQMSDMVSRSGQEVDRLRAKLSKERQKRKALETILKEEQEKTSKLDTENQGLRQEVARQREKIDVQDRKIADLEKRLEALHIGNTELRIDNEKLRQDLEDEKRNTQEQFAALKEMIRSIDIRVPK